MLPTEIREALLGDLDEAFHEHVVPARGVARARRWYWGQALRSPVRIGRPPHSRSTASRGEAMTHLASDVTFGLRLLRRKPAFSLLVTLTLAAGIGATTAIFSVVYPILVKPLPYPARTGSPCSGIATSAAKECRWASRRMPTLPPNRGRSTPSARSATPRLPCRAAMDRRRFRRFA